MGTVQDEVEIIEKLRKEMIDAGLKHGLKNELTLHLSKKLDEVLNIYVKTK